MLIARVALGVASTAFLVGGFFIAVISLGGLIFAAVSSWLYVALDVVRFLDSVGSMLWSLAIGVMLFCVGLAGVLFAFKWRGRSRGLGMPDTATVDGTTLLFGETAEHEDRTSTAPPRSQGAVTDGGSERGS